MSHVHPYSNLYRNFVIAPLYLERIVTFGGGP
jgi:hypothetical protein